MINQVEKAAFDELVYWIEYIERYDYLKRKYLYF